MKKIKDTKKMQKILYLFTVVSFIVPIIYLILRMIFAKPQTNEAGYHSEADYLLMLMQCILGLITINLPNIFEKKFRFEIPGVLYTCYIIFLYCAIFLGEVRSFYYLIPQWDTICHFFSSMMTGFFGMMVVSILNRNEHVRMQLSPLFVALFAFSFSVMIGAVWEVYEFAADGLFGMNMQKFMTADGVQLVGHAALTDTMKDIIVDILGAALSSVLGYQSIKHNHRWYDPKLTGDGKTPDESEEK